jgi:hypothetical protein
MTVTTKHGIKIPRLRSSRLGGFARLEWTPGGGASAGRFSTISSKELGPVPLRSVKDIVNETSE